MVLGKYLSCCSFVTDRRHKSKIFQIETKLRKFVAQYLIINVPYECDTNVLECVCITLAYSCYIFM